MRAAILLPGLLLASACSKGPAANDLAAQAQTHIQEIAAARTDEDRELAQEALYGCGPAAVEPIRAALRGQGVANGTILLATLSAIPDDRVPGILLAQLRSPLREIRRQALYGLSIRASLDNPREIERLAASDDVSDREWSLYALRCLGEPEGPLVRAALKDSSPLVRQQAAAGLRRFVDKKDLPALSPLLKDKDPQVRIEAALTGLKASSIDLVAGRALTDALSSLSAGTPPDRQRAARIAALAPQPYADPCLGRLLHDADPRIRTEAARCYGYLGGTSDPGALVRHCTGDPDQQVRNSAGEAACRIAFHSGDRRLQDFVTGKAFRGSGLGRTVLAGSGSEVPAWLLLEIANRDDSFLAIRAAVGLMSRGVYRPQIFKLQEELFNNTRSAERSVRRPALEILASLPTPAATARITELLSHRDPITRTMAMAAMKRRIRMRRTLPRVLIHAPPSWLDPLD